MEDRGAPEDSCLLLQFCNGGRISGPPPAPDLCACCRAVEFLQIMSTTCRLSSSDGLGTQPLSRSKCCFVCVRLQTSFDSMILSCSCLEGNCVDGWDKAAQTLDCIRVSMIGTLQRRGGWDQPFSHPPDLTYQLVPHASCINVLGPTHPPRLSCICLITSSALPSPF